MKKLSFVIPCYRSERTIEIVVSELIDKISDNPIYQYEIILVNDGSPDQVWSVIQQLSRSNKKIRGISLARNFGQHAALMAGYGVCEGDYIVSLDDDGQIPIDELDLLLEKIEEGYDVVYAYYDEIKQNAVRRFGTWMAKKMGEILLEQPKDLKGSSFYIARRYVIQEMTNYHNAYPYLAGLVFRTTKNITCVKVHHRQRMEGKSGYSFRALLSLWMNGFTAFSVKPLEIGIYLGVVLAGCGFLYAGIIIIRKLIGRVIVTGWSSLISLILIIGGTILILLGMIGEYVGRIYISINNAPQYVIKETTEDGE